MQCTLTDLPLLAAEAQDMKEHREEADSKRIHEQHMEPGLLHLLRHPNGEVTLLGTSTLTVHNPSTTSCPAGRPRT